MYDKYQPSLKNDRMILKLIENGRLDVRSETGEVFSTASNNHHQGRTGKSLGSVHSFGYMRTCISFKGKRHFFYVHRIIYIAVNGIPPQDRRFIDHINGKRTDNRSKNLEAVSMLENNMRKLGRDKSGTGILSFDEDDGLSSIYL